MKQGYIKPKRLANKAQDTQSNVEDE